MLYIKNKKQHLIRKRWKWTYISLPRLSSSNRKSPSSPQLYRMTPDACMVLNFKVILSLGFSSCRDGIWKSMNCFPVKLVVMTLDCVEGLTWMTSINTLVMMTRAARQDIFSDANVDDSKLLQISPVRLSKISYQYWFGFC